MSWYHRQGVKRLSDLDAPAFTCKKFSAMPTPRTHDCNSLIAAVIQKNIPWILYLALRTDVDELNKVSCLIVFWAHGLRCRVVWRLYM